MNLNREVLRDTLAGLLADLRKQRLLPVLGLLIVAAVAIPFFLTSSPAPVAAVRPVTPVMPATPSPAISASLPATGNTGAGYLKAPAHDPFVQPGSKTGSQKTAVSAATKPVLGQAVAVSPVPAKPAATTSTSTTKSPATISSHAAAPVRTVTVTVPTPTKPPASASTLPRPVYSAYTVSVAFGTAGDPLRTYRNLRRYQLLPHRNTVIAFLGVEGDGKTAVFVVPQSVAPAGEARCSPSAEACRFLQMQPGDQVLLLSQNADGTSSEYSLRYLSVHRKVTSRKVKTAVDTSGRRLITWAARFSTALRGMHFAPVTGELRIHLGHAVSITPPVVATGSN